MKSIIGTCQTNYIQYRNHVYMQNKCMCNMILIGNTDIDVQNPKA